MFSSSLKEVFQKVFHVDLPISGGNGQSIDDPIVIEAEKDCVALENQIIGFIKQLGGKTFKIEKQELISKEDCRIDKISIVLVDDPENYHNYYFDITKSFGRFD